MPTELFDEEEAAVADAIAEFRRENRNFRLRSESSITLFIFGVFLLATSVVGFLTQAFHPLPTLLGGLGVILFGGRFVPAFRRQTLRRLEELRDVRSVGVLVDVLEWTTGMFRMDVARLLTELLPMMTEADAHLLEFNQRRELDRALLHARFPDEADLVVAILAAWGEMGDRQSMGAVRSLTRRKGTDSRTQGVRRAAERCLTRMDERFSRAQQGKTLLRPSSFEPAANTELLRPAADSPVAPELLLRAAPEPSA
jgi:hypothetical protein